MECYLKSRDKCLAAEALTLWGIICINDHTWCTTLRGLSALGVSRLTDVAALLAYVERTVSAGAHIGPRDSAERRMYIERRGPDRSPRIGS